MIIHHKNIAGFHALLVAKWPMLITWAFNGPRNNKYMILLIWKPFTKGHKSSQATLELCLYKIELLIRTKVRAKDTNAFKQKEPSRTEH